MKVELADDGDSPVMDSKNDQEQILQMEKIWTFIRSQIALLVQCLVLLRLFS